MAAVVKASTITISQEPSDRSYGIEAVFQDLYGNPYALAQRSINSQSCITGRGRAHRETEGS